MLGLIFRLPLTLIRLVKLIINPNYTGLSEGAKYNLRIHILKGYKLPDITFSLTYFEYVHKKLMATAPTVLKLSDETIFNGALKLLEMIISTSNWAIVNSQEEDIIIWKKR